MNRKLKITDAELIALTRTGDAVAFEELVRRHRPLARRVAGEIVADDETARELVQEALLQALLSINRLRCDGQFPGWLSGIVRNVCRNYQRRRKEGILAEAFSLYWTLESVRAPTSQEPHRAVEAQEREQAVQNAVRALSTKNRDTILLFYYEQRDIEEIAGLLGASVAAVKGRLHKARRELRTRLGELLPDVTATPEGLPRRRKRKSMIKVGVVWISHRGDDPLGREDPLTSERHARHFVLATLMSQSPGYSRDGLLLVDEVGQRVVPLIIGMSATEAIVERRTDAEGESSRPVPYDLMARVLEATGVVVESVRIDVAADVEFATITLRGSSADTEAKVIREVTARPGDALALAARTGSAVYCSEAILNSANTWSLGDAMDIARRLSDLGNEDALQQAASESLIVRVTDGIVANALDLLRRRDDAAQVEIVLEPRPGRMGYVWLAYRAGGSSSGSNVPMPVRVLPAVIARFKTLVGLPLGKRNEVQRAEAPIQRQGKSYDLLVTIESTDSGERAVLQLSDPKTLSPQDTDITIRFDKLD